VFPIDWNNAETGETASGYREFGFYPQAFINMLALLGWNPGTEQEIFSLEELVQAFDLSKVSKSGAKFDFEKGKWFNQMYLRHQSDAELAQDLKTQLSLKGLYCDESKLVAVAKMMSERATFPQDLVSEGLFLFERPTVYDEATVSKKWTTESGAMIQDIMGLFADLSDFTEATTEAAFKGYLEANGLGFGKVGPAFRLAVTGMGMGPSMFAICDVLGKEEVLARMEAAVAKLG
jgi:glutamyl-tRNA synthetase